MRPTTDLFDLIKKLTPTEKRYFVLQSKLQAGKKDYLQLFWEIDRMKSYDEQRLVERLKKKGIRFSQLHVTKNQLSNQVLKTLRAFHEKKSTRQKLFALMGDASLLESMGLYKQAIKKLSKANTLAEEYEYFRFQAEVLQKLTNLKVRTETNGLRELISEKYLALFEVEKKIQIETQSFRMSHLAYSISISFGKGELDELKAEIAMLKSSELPKIIQNETFTFWSNVNRHISESFFALAENDPNGYHVAWQNILNLWKNYEHLKDENINQYRIHLTNYLNSCHVIQQYEDIKKLLPVFKNLPCKNYDEVATSAQHYHHLHLLYCLNTGHHQEAYESIPEIEECFEKYEDVLIQSQYLVISFNVFLLLFGLEKYDEAFDWLRRIADAKMPTARPDVQVFARIMQLILNYEMGNHWYVDNLYASTYRNLKKKNQLGDFERQVLTHVRKLTQAIDRKKEKEIWEKLLEKLFKIRNKKSSAHLTGLMEVAVWCKSKAERKPYFEAMKEME